ncbi:MAG: DUF2812 domain-containing protein [Clostridiales bacterium]|nr:DUF2812 domain-containing protein [Clostridiales bacterium]
MAWKSEELYEEVGFQTEFWLHARAAEQYFNRRAQEGWVLSSVESDRAVLRYTQLPSMARCRIELFAPPWIRGWQVREAAENAFIKPREEAGWKYLGQHQHCYIFVGTTGEAAEIEAEPDAEARALKRLRWRHARIPFQLFVFVTGSFNLLGRLLYEPGWGLRQGLATYSIAMWLFLVAAYVYAITNFLSRSRRAIAVKAGARNSLPELDAKKAVFVRGRGHRRKQTIVLLALLLITALLLGPLWFFDQGHVRPLDRPPYTVASVYGIEPGEIELEPTQHSLFVPDQWEYTSEGGGNRIKCRVYDSRWEWVAEYVYDDVAKYYTDYSLDEAVLRDLSLDEGSVDLRYGNEFLLAYRDGLRCVWITVPGETFEPGSPLYEAVRNRDQSSR